MTELTSILNSLQRRIGTDDQRVRAAALVWVGSGSIVAPPAMFRALDAFQAHFEDAASQAKKVKSAEAHERHARKLLIEACDDGAHAAQLLRLASSATDPAEQLLGWRTGRDLLKAAAGAYAAARNAAGCGTTC